MSIFNAFSRNVNTINLKIFVTHGGIYNFERKRSKHSGERYSPKEFIEIWNDVFFGQILNNKSGLPFFRF